MAKGRRDPKMRKVIASYVDEIRIFPETKTGELVVNAAACGLIDPNGTPVNDNDRPKGRSCVGAIAGARSGISSRPQSGLVLAFAWGGEGCR